MGGFVNGSSKGSRLFLPKRFFLLSLIFFPTLVFGISVRMSISSIDKVENRGFVVKGTVTAYNMNPKGQIVESDRMTIFADIKKDADSVYQELPDSFYIRKPAKCESPYVKGGKCMTLKQLNGVDILRNAIATFPMRNEPVWRAYGGLGKWEKEAPASVTKEFEGVIPFSHAYKGKMIQTEGRQVRIRATLKHEWGGPYAAWPAFSFHHDIAFVGTLKTYRIKDKDNDGIPDERDKCCKTPTGHLVDNNGCPMCISGIYDPSSQFADKNTGCAPRVAVIFTTFDDPNIGMRHAYFMKKKIANLKNRYRKEGYKIVEVPIKGRVISTPDKKEDMWVIEGDDIIKYLMSPSTRAMAYFGHGGQIVKEGYIWNDYQSSLDGFTKKRFSDAVYRRAFKKYKTIYCKKRMALNKASKMKECIGLDEAYIFACHSLDDNLLRNFLISKNGIYYGENGILTGVFELSKTKGHK